MAEAQRCYVHVGLPKTGTSYLQSVLARSRQEVQRQGVTLLPRTKFDRRYLSESLQDRLDPSMDPPKAYEVLERLRADAATLPTDGALISNEVLGGVGPRSVERLLDLLSGLDVHVIVTVRDLSRTIPSAWQQSIQGRHTQSFEDYVRDFVERPDEFARARRRHVLREVLATWGTHVPRERVHVVTVPRSIGAGPTTLLERFCSVVGLDASRLDTDSPHVNASLGVVQAELLRRIVVALDDRLPHRRAGYHAQGRDFLARKVLAAQDGRPPRLPESVKPWLVKASNELVDHLGTSGYHVVGDLEELRPSPSAFTAGDVVTESELVSSAVSAMADMLADRHVQTSRLRDCEDALLQAQRRIAMLEQAGIPHGSSA